MPGGNRLVRPRRSSGPAVRRREEPGILPRVLADGRRLVPPEVDAAGVDRPSGIFHFETDPAVVVGDVVEREWPGRARRRPSERRLTERGRSLPGRGKADERGSGRENERSSHRDPLPGLRLAKPIEAAT